MPIFKEDTRTQLTDLLGIIPTKVKIIFFTSERKCRSCKDTLQFMSEFCELNENIDLIVFDEQKDKEQVEKYGVERFPSMVLIDKDNVDHGVKFYGIPAGYEVHSLINSIKEAAGIDKPLNKEISNRINKINKKIHIKVFVTPQCPHCPSAVITGHKLAFNSNYITCDMIESTTFVDQSQKYNVRGVPKIIINEDFEFTGSQPISKFLEVIESIKE